MASTFTITLSLVITSWLRHVEHLLHHVDAPADPLDEGGQDGDAGLEGAGVAAEPLDRVLAALRHDLDGSEQHDGRQEYENAGNDQRHERLPLDLPKT